LVLIMNGRTRLTDALAGLRTDRPPLWLMRQAGRYLPGYRAVRAERSFWEVCRTPALSTKVALEPLARYPLDAAIVFSDILVIPEALGLGVGFGDGRSGDGPRIARPMRSRGDFDAWERDRVMERLRFLPTAVAHLREAIGAERGLLGFGGAPWTLLCYAVDGSSSEEFRHARSLLHADPALAEDALAVLADTVSELLTAQVEAGADAVQLFDTWGGLLSREDYACFALPALRRAIAPVAARVPVIVYARGGGHLLPELAQSGATCLSLDWRTSIAEARSLLGRTGVSAVRALQGNLDPTRLFAGVEAARAATRAVLADAAVGAPDVAPGFVFNLGHGILPGTPPDVVDAVCREVAGRA
jgi:uroporphyrinogen decarboxylase